MNTGPVNTNFPVLWIEDLIFWSCRWTAEAPRHSLCYRMVLALWNVFVFWLCSCLERPFFSSLPPVLQRMCLYLIFQTQGIKKGISTESLVAFFFFYSSPQCTHTNLGVNISTGKNRGQDSTGPLKQAFKVWSLWFRCRHFPMYSFQDLILA